MPDENDPPPPPDDRRIPYERFQTQVARRREAEEKVDALSAQLSDLEARASTADTLAKQLADATAAHEASTKRHGVDMRLIDAGITSEEGRDVSRFLHSRLDAEGRPAIVDWVQGLKADPTKAPMSLQPFLGTPGAAPPAGPGSAPPPGGDPPPPGGAPPPPGTPPVTFPNPGHPATPPGGTGYTVESIQAMTDEEFRAHLPTLQREVISKSG